MRWASSGHSGRRRISSPKTRAGVTLAGAPWTKEDLANGSKLAAIFVALGGAAGFFRGDGLLIGALTGALLFGFVMGVSSVAGWLSHKFDDRK
jgi:hypothetical protein